MHLKSIELSGFKSFAKKTALVFDAQITAIVGPNGSGKSNIVEAFRWALGEQSMKSLRGKRGEDLIFNGSVGQAKMNHASVTVVFDNQDKRMGLDFDEVAITRHVYRDGENKYMVNGSQVRLKDVIELLSKISIGASSHHIISQGDADRFLNSNIFERRGMVEDALGLRIYQYKKDESERKLNKTQENIKEVELLRRELAPHLKFLKKQMEEIEKARELRKELTVFYHEYLKREELYLKKERKIISEEKQKPVQELTLLERDLSEISSVLSGAGQKDEASMKMLHELETNIYSTRLKKDELSRFIGRVEGKIETNLSNPVISSPADYGDKPCPYCGQIIRAAQDHSPEAEFRKRKEQELEELKKQKSDAEAQLVVLSEKEKTLSIQRDEVKQELDSKKDDLRDQERRLFEMRARKTSLLSEINLIRSKEERLLHEEEDFKREVGEAVTLIGRDVLNYENFSFSMSDSSVDGSQNDPLSEPREVQEQRRRKLERMKIKLEDMGGIGEEVVKEYEDTLERDKFLEKEVADLTLAADSLHQVMKELSEKIETEFLEGVKKINQQFQNFFSILFGGGTAALEIVSVKRKRVEESEMEFDDVDEGEIERGIEINVSLPKKKIRGLQVLSGGERSLTSVALLFAVSQVNPPPFLVLDETDAALDESNSRKYGDMIENLSKVSQLIIITHNRETMYGADVLYGVTMGNDGVSKTLSIKFDEAKGMVKA